MGRTLGGSMMLEDYSKELYSDLFNLQNIDRHEGTQIISQVIEHFGDDDFHINTITYLVDELLCKCSCEQDVIDYMEQVMSEIKATIKSRTGHELKEFI